MSKNEVKPNDADQLNFLIPSISQENLTDSDQHDIEHFGKYADTAYHLRTLQTTMPRMTAAAQQRVGQG